MKLAFFNELSYEIIKRKEIFEKTRSRSWYESLKRHSWMKNNCSLYKSKKKPLKADKHWSCVMIEQAIKGCPIPEESDPVQNMIEKTGCSELHYSLQECMFEHRDWRKCQDLVKQFKLCMERYEKSTKVSLPKSTNVN